MQKIGLGTAAIGRPQYINIRREVSAPFSLETFKENGVKVLDEAWRIGIRYFDTAPGYGLAESLLLQWVKDKGHDEAEIATKWGYTYTANFDANASVHEVKEHSLSKLNEQWLFSKNLLPELSTYQIHSATFETGILDNERVLNRLAELKAEHGIRIGLTATGGNQVDIVKKALEVHVNGDILFDVFQVTYNVFDQSLASISQLFKNQNKRLVIKEALANGRIFPNREYAQYTSQYQKLSDLAHKYGVGVDAIALRFCIDSIPSFKVLSGAAVEQHLLDNLKAENFRLEEEEIQILKGCAIPAEQYWGERKQLKWN